MLSAKGERTMNVPDDRQYTLEHEWIDSQGRVGITDYAQDALGDVVFVELPEIGQTLKRGQSFGAVESVKSVSDLYSPMNGVVAAVNQDLAEHPDWINQDPYGSGWIVQLSERSGGDELLSADLYRLKTGGDQ